MKSFTRKHTLAYSFLLCIFITIGYLSYFTLFTMKNKTLEKTYDLFKKVLMEDADRRFSELGVPFYTMHSSKERAQASLKIISTDGTDILDPHKNDSIRSLSENEINNLLIQTFLLNENPIQVRVLDSLFNARLLAAGYPFRTAVRYTAKGKTTHSASDTSLYRSASPLRIVHTGLKDEMVLQAYVEIPFLFQVAKQKKIFFLLFSLLAFLVATCFWIVYSPMAERYIYRPIRKKPRVMQQLTENLYFDAERGLLMGYGHEVRLINYKLKLFNLLLDSPGHYRSMDDILRMVWEGAIVSNNTIEQTIRRLRKELACFSDLHIVTERKVGYRLVLGEVETDRDRPEPKNDCPDTGQIPAK